MLLRNFLMQFDENQVKFAVRDLIDLSRMICDLIQSSIALADLFLNGIKRMMTILTSDMSTLTVFQVDFVQVCLVAKQYRMALQSVEITKRKVHARTSPLDVQRYFYYAGRVYTGLKRFPQAMQQYEMCLTIPTTILTKVNVCAYQQLVLVSLIHNGRMPTLPSTLPRCVKSAFSRRERQDSLRCTESYVALGRLVRCGNLESLRTYIRQRAMDFVEDNNIGLLKQLEVSFLRHRIKLLTKMYSKVPLKDIAGLLHYSIDDIETEKVLSSPVKITEEQARRQQELSEIRASSMEIADDVPETANATGANAARGSSSSLAANVAEKSSDSVPSNLAKDRQRQEHELEQAATNALESLPVPEDAEVDTERLAPELVQEMTLSGELSARISEATGIVHFLEEKVSEYESQLLVQQMQHLHSLLATLKDLDETLTTSTKLLHKIANGNEDSAVAGFAALAGPDIDPSMIFG